MTRTMTAPPAPPAPAAVPQPLFDPKTTAVLMELDRVVADTRGAQAEVASHVTKAFHMAAGLQALRGLLTDELMARHIMPLMNTRLGFRTDRDPARPRKDRRTGKSLATQPYPLFVVRECLIEALIRGAYPVGNEWNIIGGNAYLTREFFVRAVGELPGVTNVVASPGVPKPGDRGTALVRFGLSWRKGGTADCLKDAEGKPGRVFVVRVDDYSSADQVLGKAERKAYAAAYKQITGSDLAAADEDAPEASDPVASAAPAAAPTNAPKPPPPTQRPVSEGQVLDPADGDPGAWYDDPYALEDVAGGGPDDPPSGDPMADAAGR